MCRSWMSAKPLACWARGSERAGLAVRAGAWQEGGAVRRPLLLAARSRACRALCAADSLRRCSSVNTVRPFLASEIRCRVSGVCVNPVGLDIERLLERLDRGEQVLLVGGDRLAERELRFRA